MRDSVGNVGDTEDLQDLLLKKEQKGEDNGAEKEGGNDSKKDNNNVGEQENEEMGKCSRKAKENIQKMVIEVADVEGSPRRGRKMGLKRKKNNDEPTENCENNKTKQRKWRSHSEGEGLEDDPSRGKAQTQSLAPKAKGFSKDENGFLESTTCHCHQCQRNDKGPVVWCTKCKMKRYCGPCRRIWYPNMPFEAFAEACPVCRLNCNCTSCLRMGVLVKDREQIEEKTKVKINEGQKIHYAKYIIKVLLPFLEQINAEQVMERELEAKIQGFLFIPFPFPDML